MLFLSTPHPKILLFVAKQLRTRFDQLAVKPAMPIIIKDFVWKQTEDVIIVRVPLQNTSTHKVDIFASDAYIKVHFPPFLFEACLYGLIDEEKSKCVLVKGEAVFELAKCDKAPWPSLTKDLSKKEQLEVKQEAINRAHKKADEQKKRKKELKTRRQKGCVTQQIDLNEKERKWIDETKKEEKETAVNDVIRWKNEETRDDKTLLPLWKKMSGAFYKPSKEDLELSKAWRSRQSKADIAPLKTVNKRPTTPPPRSFGKISCDFTFRAFPTPCRESKLDEEEEWLKKQAEARRLIGFVAEDLRPEENDLQWLLEKGQSFHQVKNYLGAVSAYTHAIQTWDKIPELYVARSCSQLQLGNWRRTIKDTSMAMELCRPHVPDNAEMRFTSHLNRGKALLEIGKGTAAMADFVEAMELKPYFGELEHLMNRAETMGDQREELPAQSYLEPSDLEN